MKKFFLFLILTCFAVVTTVAQEYTITSGGQGKNGHYLVKLTVLSKAKKTELEADDLVKRYAVHGVLFRGFSSPDGYGEQKPLIKDPNVEKTKADFFNAFFSEGAYKRYASVVGSSLMVTKLSRKSYELEALLLVDKESLQKYFEDSGIIEGFSNLW